jgi:hypothetical protein
VVVLPPRAPIPDMSIDTLKARWYRYLQT